jgi:hypothetical protein
MRARVRFGLVGLFCVGAACSKGRDAVTQATPEPLQAAVKPSESCSHAVCADNFFIDAPPAECAAGVACTAALKLVATGAFHINDEYPYRFKAEDAAGVEFLGTDAGGKGTFSKGAGDWQKSEEKAGTMTVKFITADKGAKAVQGTFKLSVCSAQACLLEQRQVTANVLAK